MKQEYQDFQKSIAKTHKFGFKLQFEEIFYSSVEDEISIRIAEEAISALGWQPLQTGSNKLVASKPQKLFSAGHEITVSFHLGAITVNSISTGSEMWDNGGNSKCVKLFIHVFKDIEKEYDSEKQKAVKQQIQDEENWVGYEVPEMLPPAPLREKPSVLLPVMGALCSSILIGVLLAISHYNLKHILILYEILAGIAIGYALTKTMMWSNCVTPRVYGVLIGLSAILTLFVSEYFLYRMMIRHQVDPYTFFESIGYKLDLGFYLGELWLGSVGLIVSWVFLVVACFFIAFYFFNTRLMKYLIERVPEEAVQYVLYCHQHLGMTETDIRSELTDKGWKREADQDEVFVAIEMMVELIKESDKE